MALIYRSVAFDVSFFLKVRRVSLQYVGKEDGYQSDDA